MGEILKEGINGWIGLDGLIVGGRRSTEQALMRAGFHCLDQLRQRASKQLSLSLRALCERIRDGE